MSINSGQEFVQWLDEQEKRFEYSDYEVTYNNIKPNGDINIESTYTSTRHLDIIEEI